MRRCEGWYQAIAVSRRLISQGEFEHARCNLLSIKRFVTMFASPAGLAALPPDSRTEVRQLMRELALAWRELSDVASRAAMADEDRLAG